MWEKDRVANPPSFLLPFCKVTNEQVNLILMDILEEISNILSYFGEKQFLYIVLYKLE